MAEKQTGTNEQYEPGLVGELDKQLSESDVFYDIGAQYGFISMVARSSGVLPENIHAFEGGRFRAEVCRRNHADAGAKVIERWVNKSTAANTITLDDYADRNRAPSIVKIDVEGAELAVFQGAKTILERHHPTIYCEIHPGMIQGGSVSDVVNLLEECEYSICALNHFAEGQEWQPIADHEGSDAFLIRGR
jgi:hypothetical protein